MQNEHETKRERSARKLVETGSVITFAIVIPLFLLAVSQWLIIALSS